MFGEKFYNSIRELVPEIWKLNISINGQFLALTDYDRINALAVRNNFLVQGREKIAVFNPPSTLSNIYTLLSVGLSSYGNASGIGYVATGKFEPKPGDLVYFEGKIVRFMGWETDSREDMKKFVLVNEDKWNTVTTLPASQFGLIHKYSGSRKSPDASDSKSKIVPIQKTIGTILGISPGKVKLADYGATLVCLADSDLIDLLKETVINGVKFFDLFPSVKWTSSGEQRLGKDNKKRSYMFYFIGSLSSADDLLRSSIGVRMRGLITNAGKVLRSASLFSSMASDYSLEKIWALGNANDLVAMQNLKKNGFKIWCWSIQDFKDLHDFNGSMHDISTTTSIDAVSRHFNVLNKAARASFVVEESSYPALFNKEDHLEILAITSSLRKWNIGMKNSVMDDFLISVFGLINKLFQTPVPLAQLSSGTPCTIDSYLSNLKIKAAIMMGQLPKEQCRVLSRLMEFLIKAVPLFLNHRSKYEIIKKYAGIDTCIVVKRSQFIASLEETLSIEAHTDHALISTQPQHTVDGCNALVWTYRPDLQQFLSGFFVAKKIVFVGYPLQVEEWHYLLAMYGKILEEYCNVSARAEILKIDSGLLEPLQREKAVVNKQTEFISLESELLLPRLFSKIYKQGNIRNSDGCSIFTRQVRFVGGFNAFLAKDKMVKVIEIENEGIVPKLPVDLVPGDKVVFLKEERDNVFDELVGYYDHRPDVVEILKLSESWRVALKNYYETRNLNKQELKELLEGEGLSRTEASIDNWLSGRVICPSEDNYRPIDVIAAITGNSFLIKEKDKIKNAARKVHSMRIKIGRHLARRIVQSAASFYNEAENDPVLASKLDKISSCAEIAEVEAVSSNEVMVATSFVNRLLGMDDF